jgi:FtsP/CotA-like multicopper oxidase with cupredoxin domain
MKKILKVMFYSLIALLVISSGAVYVLAKNSAMPASMNMGSMDGMGSMAGMNRDHNHDDKATPAPHAEIPMDTLIDKPTDAPVKTFEITAEEKTIDTGGGKSVNAWTYNGTIPGPELRVQEGDRVIVHLKNKNILEGVTIHWHGVELPNSQDGVAGLTQDAVRPDGEFTYHFIAKNPGTYWYHSHQYSKESTSKGLFGTLIIEPKQPQSQYNKDYTAVLHNWDNDINTVNGTSAGEHFDAKPGDLVRLRVINTASTSHTMTIVGAPFKVVAIDAYDIHEPTEMKETQLPIAASQRYDLAFIMPEHGGVKLVNVDQTGFTGNFFTKLLGLKVESAEAAHQMLTATIGNADVPAGIPTLQSNSQFDYTTYGSPADPVDKLTLSTKFDRQYEMSLGNSLGFFHGGFTMKFKINGGTFPNIPSYTVKEGDTVKIHIENKTDIPHPMHLHGHVFKVLSKNGVPLSGSPLYLSTLQIGKQESYEIAFVANNPGLWMLHCHNLDHAANGMDMMVNYEGVTTPYIVGKSSGNFPD